MMYFRNIFAIFNLIWVSTSWMSPVLVIKTRRISHRLQVTIKDLKEKLRSKGLPISGNKAELIRRLDLSNDIGSSNMTLVKNDALLENSFNNSQDLGIILRVFQIVEAKIEEMSDDTQYSLPPIVSEAREILLQAEIFDAAFSIRMKESIKDPIIKIRAQKARAFLSGFISHERRKKSKQFVSAILNTALASPTQLDVVLQEMARKDLVQVNDTVTYLTSLIEAEALKTGSIPPLLIPSKSSSVHVISSQPVPTRSDDMMRGMKASSNPIVNVLEIIRRRLVVELYTQTSEQKVVDDSTSKFPLPVSSSAYLKILAHATSLTSDDSRKQYLVEALVDRRFAREFVKFSEEGAKYLTSQVEKGFDVEMSSSGSVTPERKTIDAQTALKIKRAGQANKVAVQAREIYNSLIGI